MADLIMRELGEILATEIQDPRLSLVTISGVRLNADLRVAEVMYTFRGEERKKDVAQALESASGFLRRALSGRIDTRFIPELRFRQDTFLEDMVYGPDQGGGPEGS